MPVGIQVVKPDRIDGLVNLPGAGPGKVGDVAEVGVDRLRVAAQDRLQLGNKYFTYAYNAQPVKLPM